MVALKPRPDITRGISGPKKGTNALQNFFFKKLPTAHVPLLKLTTQVHLIL